LEQPERERLKLQSPNSSLHFQEL